MAERIALLGGLYSNYLALEAALADIRAKGASAIYCLGDLGAFGPHPARVFPLLEQHNVQCVLGNYDDSIGHAKNDCQCGYTDPRDNHFAQISYDYTLANTPESCREILRSFPAEIRLQLGEKRVLLFHGSPRKMNEFLWESTCSTAFLEYLAEQHSADVLCGTHTGIQWQRRLAGDKLFVNVGVLGRPPNDGGTAVFYTLLTVEHGQVSAEFVPVQYNYQRLGKEMLAEGLPHEFVETLHTGYWTTCLEILPQKERRRGVH